MIDPLLAATLNGTTPAPAASPNDQISQQQFLTLFIAQLQNQDPLAPLEPEQLTAQLAQMSSLEQLTGINERLDALTAATVGTQATTALGLIGRMVDVETSQLPVKDGAAPSVEYTLSGSATVTVDLFDDKGKKVWSKNLGSVNAGEQTLTLDDVPLPDGTYRVQVSALAAGAEKAVDGAGRPERPRPGRGPHVQSPHAGRERPRRAARPRTQRTPTGGVMSIYGAFSTGRSGLINTRPRSA